MSDEEYKTLYEDKNKDDKAYIDTEAKFYVDGLKLHRENKLKILLCGIGDGYFYFNETFEPNKDELTFETLYDYDVDNFIYQKRMISEYSSDKPKETDDFYKAQYRLQLNAKWARCYFKEEVANSLDLHGQYYITIYSVSTYVYFLLEAIYFELDERLLTKKNKLRGQLILGEFSQKLEDELAVFNEKTVWIEDNTINNNERTLSIIIPNINTAKKIRLQHFQEDLLNTGTRNTEVLEEISRKYIKLFNTEIKNTFD
jgi:hypothetical protein